MDRKLKILFASSEIHPYAKTGGLGDISGSLPVALRRMGHEVRCIMPKYKSVADASEGFSSLRLDVDVPIGPASKKAFLFQGHLDHDLPVYLLANDAYFLRDGIYGEDGKDYADNAERFIFFCRAILETCKALDFQPDIIHCNDWQTGLVPAYLRTLYAKDPWLQNTRTLFSIHNLGYQGNFPAAALKATGLPATCFTMAGLEFFGQVSFLKSGLVYADLLSTVSPNYSKEIQTKTFGFGMEGVLQTRSKDLFGILNGADGDEWNPKSDPFLKTSYHAADLAGKRTCKKELTALFSLKEDPAIPLVGMVTRLSDQKGIQLVKEAMEAILKTGAAFVLLGSGDPVYEEYFSGLNKSHPGQCGAVIGFDESLAHKIVAGADLFLMPSQYEPCGLTQMYAMLYGTAPIVHAVGGLKDTVTEFDLDTGSGTGFLFSPFSAAPLLKAFKKALSAYKNPAAWPRLMQNGMQKDFGWSQAAGQYTQLYLKALKR